MTIANNSEKFKDNVRTVKIMQKADKMLIHRQEQKAKKQEQGIGSGQGIGTKTLTSIKCLVQNNSTSALNVLLSKYIAKKPKKLHP